MVTDLVVPFIRWTCILFDVQIPNEACTQDQSQLRRAEGSRSRGPETCEEEEAAGSGWG